MNAASAYDGDEADRTVHVVTMSWPSPFVGGCDDDGFVNLDLLLAGEMPVILLRVYLHF